MSSSTPLAAASPRPPSPPPLTKPPPSVANAAGPAAAPAVPFAVAPPVKGRPLASNLTCSGLLLAKQPPYKKNLNDGRCGDKGAKARNEAINTTLIDELGHACGWDINNLYSAVGPDGKRDPGVKREPVDASKLDYAAQQVHEGRQIAWRRLVRQPVQSRMGGYARNAQAKLEASLTAQLGTLRTVIGPEAHAMPFDKFLVGHERYGWRAFQDARYCSLHDGGVPVGQHALASRVAFVTQWYKSAATQAERDVVDGDYCDYKEDLNSVHTRILLVGEAGDSPPGDVLDVEERFACSVGIQPVLSRVVDGLSRSTGLSFLTVAAGHMQSSGAETMRIFGVGTDFDHAPPFQDWASGVWIAFCQAYMAYSRSALATRVDSTPMPTFESLEATFKQSRGASTQPSTPLMHTPSLALPTPSPMIMSAPSTPSVPPAVIAGPRHEDVTMTSPTPPRLTCSTPARGLTTMPAAASPRSRCTAPSVSAPAHPSTPRAATVPLFMPRDTSPTRPASSPPPYTSTPTPTSQMRQPSGKTLLNRRAPALPRLRIATDRVHSSRDGSHQRTPHLPSSPLVNAAFSAYTDDDDEKDDSFGLAHLLDSPLPPSLSQMKAYANGGASQLQQAVPGNSSVLASSEADIFSDGTPFLIRVDSARQRIDLRVDEDAYASMAGGQIGVSTTGTEVSSTSLQARAITVMPARGLAAVAFLRGGEACVNIARAWPSSPPPSSPVPSDAPSDVEEEEDEPVDVPGAKRKRAMVQAALPSSPDEPKRARKVYMSSACRTRETAVASAPPSVSIGPRRSGRAASAAQGRAASAPQGRAVSAAHATDASTRRLDHSTGRGRDAVPRVVSGRGRAGAAPPAYRPAPLSGLCPARDSDLIAAGVSTTALQCTAFSECVPTIMLHAKQLGKAFVELLGHLITIDQHVAKASFPKSLLVGRPAQVRFFAKSRRVFQPAVFEEFDGTYAIRFWSWWNTLVGDMCYPDPGVLRRPGRLLVDADFTTLLCGGHNGFGTVVASLAIWIFGFMRTTPSTLRLTFTAKPAVTQVAAWSAAVVHVGYIAAVMVDSLPI